VRLTPEEIEARRFRLAPNGYDCEAVDRFLADITEALREQPAPTSGSDEFSRVGQEIAAVLRAARDSAGAVRAEAKGQAAAARSRAEAEATDLRKEAKAQLHQAQQTLAEARSQAELLVAEAEHHAEEIKHAERVARQRLLATRTDLQNLIDRLGAPNGKAVLDLTDESDETAAGTTEGIDPLATGGPGTEVGSPANPPAELGDPLLRMVRAAVGHAAEHSEAEAEAADELDTEAVEAV
jgi:DivIVA domain-containing protein